MREIIRRQNVLIKVGGNWSGKRKVDFIDAIEDGIVASLQTPKNDNILRLIEHYPVSVAGRKAATNRSFREP